MKSMKPLAVVLVAFAMVLVAAVPAYAEEPQPVFETGTAQEICADNTIMITFGPDTFPFEIPSHGGCVSTVLRSELDKGELNLTSAAFASQCRMLQDVLPSFIWDAPVEIVTEGYEIPTNVGGFGGKIGSCIPLLRGYHTHTLGHL